MLELQSYPEIRLAPDLPPLPPYDVTAWSLGLQMGVGVEFVDRPFEASLQLVDGVSLPLGGVEGQGDLYLISAEYNDAFIAVNRLWAAGAKVSRATNSGAWWGRMAWCYAPGAFVVESVSREEMDRIAGELGIRVQAVLRLQGEELVDASQASHRDLPALAVQHGRGMDPVGSGGLRLRLRRPPSPGLPGGRRRRRSRTRR